MNNIAVVSTSRGRDRRVVNLPEHDVNMLRAELELMIHEDTYLKRIAGAAALLVARLDRVCLSGGTAMAAFALAGLIDDMPEELVNESLNLFKSGEC
ncbi:MAG: hypothetical protein KGZ83_12360 [Sulfuricella sp.]|nr:hypothetical protein [Sulfuricella sp.]